MLESGIALFDWDFVFYLQHIYLTTDIPPAANHDSPFTLMLSKHFCTGGYYMGGSWW